MSSRCASCCTTRCDSCSDSGVSRRGFLAAIGAAGATLAAPSFAKDPVRQKPIRNALAVQPVFTYRVPQRREATSWREWGGILSEADAASEKERIGRELAELKKKADFPLDIRPLAVCQTPEEAARISAGTHDTTIVYAAGGGLKMIETLTPEAKWNLMFVRHNPGPAYLWYEIAHPRYLRKTVDQYGQPGMTAHDVVVDKHSEMLWRLRALGGLKNTFGKKILAIGGASGWGDGGRKAPQIARDLWKLNIETVEYPALAERIKLARKNDGLVKRAHAAAEAYLKPKDVVLETKKDFVLNAFVLTEVFRELLDESKTDTLTINQCMGTIMPMSETTACLPLSLLNDDGYLAFCESDFVVIPSGILLHYIAGTPVFLNDPTYPHDGMVTIAHCTAPRRMDGVNQEPVRVMTHFESDYGAAPKVEMKKGKVTTNLVPDFDCKQWVGFTGDVLDNPFLHICRSQTDVSVKGDCMKLAEEMKGFHWMMSYGDYLKETGYALRKLGVGLTLV